MTLVLPVINGITLLLAICAAVLGIWAAADAGARRPDAFAAADKQTKGTWSGITIAAAVVSVLGLLQVGAFAVFSLLWLAAVIGELVYLLEVRPKLRQAQSGSRW